MMRRDTRARRASHAADTAEPGVRRSTEGAQSIKRALAVLRIVAAHGASGATLKEVAAASGLHKATAHRILCALADERILEQDAADRSFHAGMELYALGTAMGDRFDIRHLAEPSVDRLSRSTRDTVYLGVRTGDDGLCIAMREGSYPLKTLRLHVHDRWPLGVGAFSMPLLAALPDAEVNEILKANAHRLRRHPEYSPANLLRRIEETRKRGYATDRVVAYPGMCGIGVPILDANDRPIASLCIVSALARMPDKRQAQIAREIWVESRKISELWRGAREVRVRDDARSRRVTTRARRGDNSPGA
jgi:DNA-binding IclR family transcriptional regulator